MNTRDLVRRFALVWELADGVVEKALIPDAWIFRAIHIADPDQPWETRTRLISMLLKLKEEQREIRRAAERAEADEMMGRAVAGSRTPSGAHLLGPGRTLRIVPDP